MITRFRYWIVLGWACLVPALARPGYEPPVYLPRYHLNIHIDTDNHKVVVQQQATWINYHKRPTQELVFNVHSHYQVPTKEVGFVAKMVEILRTNPTEALDLNGPPCEIEKVLLMQAGPAPGKSGPVLGKADSIPSGQGDPESLPPPKPVPTKVEELPFHYAEDNQTALVVPLPRPVGQGEAVTVTLEFSFRLPQKMGRWGQWKGVTFLSNWLPVLAFYDECGWKPTPFIPWHQPFFNEAGIYTAQVTIPCDQNFASTGSATQVKELGNGLKVVEIGACCARDFAFLCSARFVEYTGMAGPVRVRCLALPEHEHFARVMVQSACEAIPTYSRWFGPYPYPEFNIVESYFGWNGNECSGLIMIDERVFDMPHVAGSYVDYLICHETCHQWWYNAVGTNGYAETWMDEGLATHFSYRLVQQKHGKKGNLLEFPKRLQWLPNIPRQTYRSYSMYGTMARGEACPTVQDLPKYSHLVNLFSMTYDRGGRVVGMIEDRLGETAFLDFMRILYQRYYFRIMRVADFQRELEAYTKQSWEPFFQEWVYGKGTADWCVEKVNLKKVGGTQLECHLDEQAPSGPKARNTGPYQVSVLLRQKAEYDEQTVLGFSLDGSDNYQIRIPIVPGAPDLEFDDPPTRVENVGEHCVRVHVLLPCKPTQISVDPDQIVIDREPANNHWKRCVRWRFTPVYTQLEETDLTTDYDRVNFTLGPWIYGATYADPWYQRSNVIGVRAGFYRTQHFSAGTYLAYRADYRDIAAGVDGLVDHWPFPRTQVGFNAERGLTDSEDDGRSTNRGVLFGRYVFQYTSSLYLPPMHYLEAFTSILENSLPLPRNSAPGAVPFDHMNQTGLHYHLDYLTPYWDPVGGFRFDVTAAAGLPIFGEKESIQRLNAQFSMVKGVPDGLGWLSSTRMAFRLFGGTAWPREGEFFALGGPNLFRGFDLEERQGSQLWVGSVEWRVPIIRGLEWDTCDHCMGVRAINTALFYDVGDVYVNGHSFDGVAHAVGAGLRLDVVWFSFVERTTLRLDVAKTVNASTPTQFWFGVQHPF